MRVSNTFLTLGKNPSYSAGLNRGCFNFCRVHKTLDVTPAND
jgi:hypothetical protein